MSIIKKLTLIGIIAAGIAQNSYEAKPNSHASFSEPSTTIFIGTYSDITTKLTNIFTTLCVRDEHGTRHTLSDAMPEILALQAILELLQHDTPFSNMRAHVDSCISLYNRRNSVHNEERRALLRDFFECIYATIALWDQCISTHWDQLATTMVAQEWYDFLQIRAAIIAEEQARQQRNLMPQ